MNTYDPAAGILYLHVPHGPAAPRVDTPGRRPHVRHVALRTRRRGAPHASRATAEVPADGPAHRSAADVPVEQFTAAGRPAGQPA